MLACQRGGAGPIPERPTSSATITCQVAGLNLVQENRVKSTGLRRICGRPEFYFEASVQVLSTDSVDQNTSNLDVSVWDRCESGSSQYTICVPNASRTPHQNVEVRTGTSFRFEFRSLDANECFSAAFISFI